MLNCESVFNQLRRKGRLKLSCKSIIMIDSLFHNIGGRWLIVLNVSALLDYLEKKKEIKTNMKSKKQTCSGNYTTLLLRVTSFGAKINNDLN